MYLHPEANVSFWAITFEYCFALFVKSCNIILQTAVARESRNHWTRKRWKWCDFNTEFLPLHRLLVIHHFLAMKWIIWGRRLQGSLLVLTSVLLGTSCLKRKRRRRRRVKVKYKPPLYDTVKVKHGKEPLRVVTNLRRPWSWVSGGGRGGGGRLQGEILLSSAEALAEYLNKNSKWCAQRPRRVRIKCMHG